MEVSTYYICYFDILGYKDLLRDFGENNFLQIINGVMQEVLVLTKRRVLFPFDDLYFEYRIFSDNVIMCYHMPPFKTHLDYIKSINKEYYFNSYLIHNNTNYELLYLSLLIEHSIYLQKKLIEKYGIFIRGAITKGNLYCDKNYIYGQGIIDAYNLENNFAKFPRIIISDLINNFLTSFSESELHLHRLESYFIIKDRTDNIPFLNYLSGSDNFFWETHRDLIKTNLIKYFNIGSVYEKYCWCKKYHNNFCLYKDQVI